MANKVTPINILEIARGAVMEQIDIEIAKIVANLADPNTDFKVARKLTVTLAFKNVDERRNIVGVEAQAKAALAPNYAIAATLYSEDTADGPMVAELTKPDPNQVSFEEEQGVATTNVINMKARMN